MFCVNSTTDTLYNRNQHNVVNQLYSNKRCNWFFFLQKHQSEKKWTIFAFDRNELSSFEDSVQFSCSVVSDSLRPHESQHTRPPCPSKFPEFAQTHVHRVGDARRWQMQFWNGLIFKRVSCTACWERALPEEALSGNIYGRTHPHRLTLTLRRTSRVTHVGSAWVSPALRGVTTCLTTPLSDRDSSRQGKSQDCCLQLWD